ncbi:MAG: hypothetical protein PHY63_04630 [Candidatus Cloacimonetes bacterium]|nr:hypothetical protein [Candidatus Cloacimonas acidaminovorans]MDD5624998.1 hypothetical protein [Candidatus Cloacimonadota bacterium]
MEEKIEGRKVQSLPFLLSRNMRKYTLKNTGFCPNKVIHFRILVVKRYTKIILQPVESNQIKEHKCTKGVNL